MSFRGPLLKPGERNGRQSTTRVLSTIVDKKESRFDHLKRVVRSGLQTTFEVGAALLEIRDSKLYREEFNTFEEFCESEFKIVRRRAYQLIEAAQVKASLCSTSETNLSTIVHKDSSGSASNLANKITTESQARALAGVPEENRIEVLEKVSGRGPVTAKAITEAAKESQPAKPEKKPDVLTDKFGRVIPDDMVADWQRAEAVGKRLRSLASEIKVTVSDGFAGAKQDKLKDVIYAEVGNSIITDAGALSYSLATIIPYALCPSCNGRQRGKCTLCRKRGWISKYLWNSPVVNDDIKKLIERVA